MRAKRTMIAAAMACMVVILACERDVAAQEPANYLVGPGLPIDVPLEQAVAQAHAVVVATVTGAGVRFAPSDPPPDPRGFRKVVTEYAVTVCDVIKQTHGSLSPPVAFWLLGGRVVAGRPLPDGEPILRVGATYVLMLRWNDNASTYELDNAGESTWELVDGGRLRAVGRGKHVKAHATKSPERFLKAVRRLAAASDSRAR